MRRGWAILAAAVAVLAIASQLVIPVLSERAVADRLTENGGEAAVEIRSFPAVRLLWSSGERISVAGSDLRLDDGEMRLEDLSRLDGFGEVDVQLTESEVGPMRADRLELTRSGERNYRLSASGDLSPAQALAAGARDLNLPGGALAPALANLLPDFLDPGVPVDLDFELMSDDGEVTVVDGSGTVAGVPAGTLAELIARALATQL